MSDRTYCRICEAACGLVGVRDGAGRLLKLVPDREHPTSRGFSCAKGTRFVEVASHPDRLLSPKVREGDRLVARRWPEAMGRVVSELVRLRAEHGPHAVGVYFGNPIAFNATGSIALLALLRALGTRNVFSAGSQDCANKFAGARLVHGSALVHPIPDVEHTDLLVVLGSNPAVSQSSFVHLPGGFLAILRLLERGGDVIWVDPRRTESAARGGHHLALRPGTDVFLLLAWLHELRDLVPPSPAEGLDELLAVAARFPVTRAAAITGLSERAIVDVAVRLRRANGAALHLSVGVNQGPFGTLAYVVAQAISFVTGNLDRRGGSLIHPLALGGASLFRRLGIGESTAESRVGGFRAVLDALPAGVLADEITTEGPDRLRALLVIAGDPLRSVPGEGALRDAFAKLDLLVTIDLFENETGKLADVLLPTTSWLERWDFATTTATFQTSPLLQTASPMSPAPGETRGEHRILLELAARVSGRRSLLALSRLPVDRLRSPGLGVRVPVPTPGRYRERGLRLRFFSDELAAEVARLDDEAARLSPSPGEVALSMIGRRRRIGHNGWIFGGVRDRHDDEPASMHPRDLAARGITPGTHVRIATEVGAIELLVEADEGVLPGTIVVPHGLPGALNVNAIIPSGTEAIERPSGQHRMTAIPVVVEPAHHVSRA